MMDFFDTSSEEAVEVLSLLTEDFNENPSARQPYPPVHQKCSHAQVGN
jgi:hypothetical protein